jgi:hypothetical protein
MMTSKLSSSARDVIVSASSRHPHQKRDFGLIKELNDEFAKFPFMDRNQIRLNFLHGTQT